MRALTALCGLMLHSLADAETNGELVKTIFASALNGGAAWSEPFLLADGDVGLPLVASGGGDYLATWQKKNESFHDIEVVQVAANGEIDSNSRGVIATGESAKFHRAIASNGSGYFVAWNDSVQDAPFGDIHGRPLSLEGLPQAESELVSRGPNGQLQPRVAATGDGFVAAWLDRRRGGTMADVYFSPMTAEGESLHATGIPLHPTAGRATALAMAGRAGEALVVWVVRERPFGSLKYRLLGARVGADGSVLDSEPIAIAGSGNWAPAVAAGADLYLVVWSDKSGGIVRVARVDSTEAFGCRRKISWYGPWLRSGGGR